MPPAVPQQRHEIFSAAICALFGLLLSTLPFFHAWFRTGQPWYFPDPDATSQYLHFVAHAYNFHPWKLADPALALSGASIFPWLPFVPFIATAKAFSMTPAGVFFLWAIWGGAATGAILYFLLRCFITRPIVAVVFTFLLLADTGLAVGRPFDRQISQLLEVTAKPDAFAGAWSNALQHLRIVNPIVSWPFLGLFLLAILKLNQQPTTKRLAVAIITFGLLFYVYFYYWTAAAASLALAFLFQLPLRKAYFKIALGGLLLGLPWLLYESSIRAAYSPEWLHRNAFFIPVARAQSFQIPKITLFWIAAAIFALWRLRDVRAKFLVLFVLASLALANQSVVTGLELQNSHWRYTWGIGASLLAFIALAVCFEKIYSRKLALIASLLAVAHVSAGVYLRTWEFTRAEVPVRIQRDLADYLNERVKLEPARIMAGDPAYVDFAVGFDQQIALVASAGLAPSVSNREWLERRTLDAWLRGVPREKAFDAVYGYFATWHQINQMSEAQKAEDRQAIETLYAVISGDPIRWLNKFQIRYAALPAKREPLPLNHWRKVTEGIRWTIWQR